MLNQLLPQRIDNTYRGYRLALWLLALLVLQRVGMGLSFIFNGYYTAIRADGIPLDALTPAAAGAVVSVLALWGLAQAIFGLLGTLVLVRYRALVPFMFALLLLEQQTRKLILRFVPFSGIRAAPGFYINIVLLVLMIVGLALSLWSRDNIQDRTDLTTTG